MSSINFLPDKNKDGEKSEKKVRTIEYTSPKGDVKKEKKSSHGGVLSIFKKSSTDIPKPPQVPTLPSKPQQGQKSEEPIVKSHNDVKKVEQKTVITYQQPEEKKKIEGKKNKKKPFGWFKGLFSRSKKKGPSEASLAVPQNDAPSYEPSKDSKGEKKEQKAAPPPPSFSSKNTSEKSETVKKAVAENDASVPPLPPPPFSPFHAQEKSGPKTQGTAEKVAVPSPPTPKAATLGAPPAPITQPGVPASETAEDQMSRRPRTPGGAFDVNLVPDELVQRKRTMSRLALLGVIVLVSAFVCLALYGVLSFYKTNIAKRVVDIDQQTFLTKNEINALKPVQRDALVLQKRTEEVKTLLDNQIHWTQLFTALEKYTLKQVALTKISAKSDGIVTIEGEAPDAATAFEQINVLKQASEFAETVTITTTPTIPKSATTFENVGPASLPFASPNTQAPGEGESPTSKFAVQVQLVPDLLSTTTN